jgi:hypothetical protein
VGSAVTYGALSEPRVLRAGDLPGERQSQSHRSGARRKFCVERPAAAGYWRLRGQPCRRADPWNGSWTGRSAQRGHPVLSVHPAGLVQPARLVLWRVHVMNRSSVRFRQAAPKVRQPSPDLSVHRRPQWPSSAHAPRRSAGTRAPSFHGYVSSPSHKPWRRGRQCDAIRQPRPESALEATDHRMPPGMRAEVGLRTHGHDALAGVSYWPSLPRPVGPVLDDGGRSRSPRVSNDRAARAPRRQAPPMPQFRSSGSTRSPR